MAEEILNAETVEVAEVADTAKEVVEEVAATEEVAGETSEVTEAVEEIDSAEETTEESDTPPQAEEEISFSPDDDLATFQAKKSQVLDKYELPAEVQSVIDALESRVSTVPEFQFSDYGAPEEVKTVLESNHLLRSSRIEEDNSYRPNTDKWAEKEMAENPEGADWAFYDLSLQPSRKYTGLNKFKEQLVDAIGQEGETIGDALQRYDRAIAYMKGEAQIPIPDTPSFIPQHLQKAFARLPKESREDIYLIDVSNDDADSGLSYADERTRKIAELEMIQEGIDAKEVKAKAITEQQKQQQVEFANNVQTKETGFFNGLRKAFRENLNEITFSDDAQIQSRIVGRNAVLFEKACEDSDGGELARQDVEASGVKFDFQKVKQLQIEASQAIIDLATAERNPNNKVEINKAQSKMREVTKSWQDYSGEVIKELARAEVKDLSKEAKAKVEKIKIHKSRPNIQTIPSTKGGKERPPQAGTPEFTEWYADKMIEEQRQRVNAYR